MSRAEAQSRKSFSLRFWLRMIGGELQRTVVCTKLHPNASLSPPLFDPKKSGKWPEEEWKVTQRRINFTLFDVEGDTFLLTLDGQDMGEVSLK